MNRRNVMNALAASAFDGDWFKSHPMYRTRRTQTMARATFCPRLPAASPMKLSVDE